MPPPLPLPTDPEPPWPIPQFTLRVEDLAHPGAKLFFDHIRADEALRHAVVTVCTWLYTPESVPTKYAPLFFKDRRASASPPRPHAHFRLPPPRRPSRPHRAATPRPRPGCSVQHVTLVLRPMDGVAHTFGSATHKEIHLSLDHVRNSRARVRDEVLGVLVHEMVHCFQYNGRGAAPGGLIEGVAGACPCLPGPSLLRWALC